MKEFEFFDDEHNDNDISDKRSQTVPERMEIFSQKEEAQLGRMRKETKL